MKTRYYLPFPYATVQKNYNTSMFFLKKLKQKPKFKQKNRVFSLELGRSLSKRVLWQTALSAGVESFHKKENLTQNSLSFSWKSFRVAFFAKIALLKNASVVPGAIWPTKSKKMLLVKMKAFKAFSFLFGKEKASFGVKNLQKIFANSFSMPTRSFLWNIAGGFDSLKAPLFYKSAFSPTLGNSFQRLNSRQVRYNGFVKNKTLSFAYPGDFAKAFFPNTFFANNFSFGKITTFISIYNLKPFLWLISFYQPFFSVPKQKKSYK